MNMSEENFDFTSQGLEVDETGAGLYPRVPYEERLVGMAYTTWNRPEIWAGSVWSTPQLGQYNSDDREVIRKHGQWLYDAGVDFIWIDWSNDVLYDPETMSSLRPDFDMIERSTQYIFEEYSGMEHSPKISIFLGCPGVPEAIKDGSLTKKADQVYDWFVSNSDHPEYRDLVQDYLGKPLLVIYANTPSHWQTGTPRWDDERFTVRWMTGFVTEQSSLRDDNLISKKGFWSWEDRGAQTFTVHNGIPESMIVVPSWRPQGEEGGEDYIPAGEREEGKTFKEQWARARLIGVKFAMVGTWNEWVTGEQYSETVSKDIEPSEALGDFYLKLLKEEIAKFKGFN